MMKEIQGIAASPGKAVGTVFQVKNPPGPTPVQEAVGSVQADRETGRFRDACRVVKDRLSRYAKDHGIFTAQIEILNDIGERVIAVITQEKISATEATEKICAEVCALFVEIDDEYLRSRSDDIADVCRQVTLALEGNDENPYARMSDNSILIAENLLASDLMQIDLSKLAGIALKRGSVTSHLAVMAREYGIPLVAGAGDELDSVPDGSAIVIDGSKGMVMTDPEKALLAEIFTGKSLHYETGREGGLLAMTKDGVEIAVYANAGSIAGVENAIKAGADGIGLLRTEFIFMQEKEFPEEEKQYRIYSECARICGDKILTVRTLDAGADKQLPYFPMKAEENPVLGLRGIRFSLSLPDIFKVQLRAILRAAASGNIRLMLPMITSVEEYRLAGKLLETCKAELKNEGTSFCASLRVGLMMETPASVMLADELAQEAAFFSIGTNDLTQYVLAVDRNNPYAVNACDSFHPAVLKSLSEVISAAAKHGKDVSVCGEMASDPRATGLLLKLGVRKLSVTGCNVPFIKNQIRSLITKI
ncbi:MAG: phosphoenolpyruvate--protein phosphotransferase [Dysgonamonadaceae bacterium]|jgi:phosphotransferase system enzyme I (PtsI)|nr:phosphoenolpyruvate--protein phosphotransferase [Dysgonamonadaceae bacterium]